MNSSTPSPNNAKHAVIFLHGLCGTPLEMGAIPRSLEQLGFSVVMLEIPEYSASAVVLGHTPDWQMWRDVVDAEVSRLAEDHDTVSLCGLSMGATLALAVAAEREDILAVVALSPVLRYDGWAIPCLHWLLEIPFWLGIRNWSYKEHEPYGLRNVEMRRRVARGLEKEGVSEVGAAAIPARQLDAAKRMMRAVRQSLEQVRAHLLVIQAIDDETTAPRNAEMILRRVSSETRKAIWLGDCYHIITFDNEREIVTNEAVRFIQNAAYARGGDKNFRRRGRRASLRDRR